MHRYKIEERKVYPIFAAKKFHKEISHDGAQNLWQGLEMNQVIPGSWDSQSFSTVRRTAGSEGVLFFLFKKKKYNFTIKKHHSNVYTMQQACGSQF